MTELPRQRSTHYDTRYTLTLAGFYVTESGGAPAADGVIRPRQLDVRFVLTPLGAAALEAAEARDSEAPPARDSEEH